MLTVKVGFSFSKTEAWLATMLSSTLSPWLLLPGVPTPGSSLTVVVAGALSRVRFSNLLAPAPPTDCRVWLTELWPM
ncbi:hypothetical protein D3C76_579760 [compost metagenome]